MLDGLGRVGLTTASPAVARAIEFLRAQQFDHGGFWGRWTVNYLASTACVLQGLARVGADMSEPWVRRAVALCSSARTRTAVGVSCPTPTATPRSLAAVRAWPPLTGLVLTGLIDAGEASSDAVARGIAYLLDHQCADGTWPHGDWLQAIVPPDTFYILAEAARHYPVEALAGWLEPPHDARSVASASYSGCGNCVPATASHMRSVSTACWPRNSQADGVTG